MTSIARAFAFALLACWLPCSTAIATGSAPTQKETSPAAEPPSRAKPPIAAGMPSFRLPPTDEAVLDNGMRIVVVRDTSPVPMFAARLVLVDGGGLHEPADRRGLAAFAFEMLREGTTSRSGEEIARQLETYGATLETDAALDAPMGSITISGLGTHFEPLLALFSDMVRNPSFQPQAVERHAAQTTAQLALMQARPQFVSQQRLLRAIYGDHPAGLAAAPAAAIQAITADDLHRFHATHFRPDGAILVILAQTSLQELLPAIRAAFADWKQGDALIPPLPGVPAPSKRAIALVDRPGSVQTTLQVGTIGITRTDPDYFALTVMNQVFGGGATSRLYRNLREEHGYTYGAYSGFGGSTVPGIWQITTSVRTPVTGDAMRELLAEVRRIRTEPISESELASAVNILIGRAIFSLERPEVLLDYVATRQYYGFPRDYWDRYADNLRAVTIADVKRVAGRIVDPVHLQIAAVGDAGKIGAGLAEFGPLHEATVPGAPAPAASQEGSPVQEPDRDEATPESATAPGRP